MNYHQNTKIMKTRLFALFIIAVLMTACNGKLWDAVDDLKGKYSELDGRVSQLEELCKQMNTNITSLQTLVSVIVNNDYIVTITPIMKENQEIGYTITFAIHDPITIMGKTEQTAKTALTERMEKTVLTGKTAQMVRTV